MAAAGLLAAFLFVAAGRGGGADSSKGRPGSYGSPFRNPRWQAEVSEELRRRMQDAAGAISRARSDFRDGRYAGALGAALEAMKKAPRSFEAHRIAGSALYCLNDRQSASYHFKLAAEHAAEPRDRAWSQVMYLVSARDARIAEAEGEFARMTGPAGLDARAWPDLGLAAGTVAPEEGLAALLASGAWKSPAGAAAAGFFAGMGLLRAGDDAAAAGHFLKSAASGAADAFETHFSRIEASKRG